MVIGVHLQKGRMSGASRATATAAAVAAREYSDTSLWVSCLAVVCGTWFVFIIIIQAIGSIQLYRHYSVKPKAAVSPTLEHGLIPHITILRPVKGVEAHLYQCLSATFQQTYPTSKLTIYFCIETIDDAAYPLLQRLLADFPNFDAHLFVEQDDPNLSGEDGQVTNLGPNPKIRNMSRGYREAKGDIIWIIDCNVWVGPGVAGRMVDKLCGFRSDGKKGVPYKFVHQLPLVIDAATASITTEPRGLPEEGVQRNTDAISFPNRDSQNEKYSKEANHSQLERLLSTKGGRLEEIFMATSHAKFYSAISTVAIAPCIVGKSNMFRKSHLDFLTSSIPSFYPPGIDHFSSNICEDHLIGDLLWRKIVLEEISGEQYFNHGLVFGDLAIQPMGYMSVQDYIARRVRWLRVRKWTVTLATLVEPGIEPLLCSAYGAFAATTLPLVSSVIGVPQTWLAFMLVWLSFVAVWMALDVFVYKVLHSGKSIEFNVDTPSFVTPPETGSRRPLRECIVAWVGREILAWPVWAWACLGGTMVMWRGRRFKVGMDMKVVEVKEEKTEWLRKKSNVSGVNTRANNGKIKEN